MILVLVDDFTGTAKLDGVALCYGLQAECLMPC
ncbi:uncharacterized protein METZ01_LOCUS217980 [marine metagenome]|uniref:Four-carbon acid sugar kinase N-terminal domain-containing protein n=1 Tax=marine metagenome TaxID=408172 RepID=A0A382FPS2_9ZZZZ